MEKYINQYNDKCEQLKRLIDSTIISLNKAQEDYQKILNSDTDKKDKKLEHAGYAVKAYHDYLDVLNKRLSLVRLRNDEDMFYRQRQYLEFSKLVQMFIPEDLQIRFHGTPFCHVEDILKAGKINRDRLAQKKTYVVSRPISI